MSELKRNCDKERRRHCGGFRSLPWPVLFLLAGAWAPLSDADRSHLPPTCDSTIYCHGPLLDKIQMAAIYPDSKTFVDMKLKVPANRTMLLFNEMMNKTGNKPTKADIEEFVADNFDPEGSEFENWTPDDWKKEPAFLQRIKDPDFRKWASGLNELWLNLGRKMKSEVKENQELYSIIYVDHPVIVPGGRFREFYYWDSYWIVRGLLLSEMYNTTRGMLTNFIDIVERMGHIPNGGRIYYMMRSQPPLLTPMIKTYMDTTHDVEFLRQHIHTLDREFDFWMRNHTTDVLHNGNKYKLARYIDKSRGPRPESYREDVESASSFQSNDLKEEYYAELKAAAESGWDFSTRWFVLDGTNKGNLTNLKTRSIIPVDLNAILCWNADLLAEFHEKLGNRQKQVYYENIAHEMKISIEKVLWHEEIGVWLDWDADNGRRRDYFYPSNVAPLWTNSYDRSRSQYFVSRIIKYLDNTKVDNYAGGIPTTFEHSGEQWDYPNAWPPLQHIVVEGLANTRLPAAMRLGREWAAKWVRSNYAAWKENEAMYEKYDATRVGGYGGGGEYEVQAGFGWTNGIIMDLLNFYGGILSAVDAFEAELIEDADSGVPGSVVLGAGVGMGGVLTALLVIAATLTAGALGFVVYKKRQEQQGGSSNYAVEGVRLLSQDKGYTELRSINGTSSNGKMR